MDGDDDWYDPEATTFGDRLAGAREAAGLEPVGLARRLGVRTATLRAWEGDRAEPRANRVQMLAGLLNVSLVWLLTGEGEGPTSAADAEGAEADLRREVTRARRDAERMVERLRAIEARLEEGT